MLAEASHKKATTALERKCVFENFVLFKNTFKVSLGVKDFDCLEIEYLQSFYAQAHLSFPVAKGERVL